MNTAFTQVDPALPFRGNAASVRFGGHSAFAWGERLELQSCALQLQGPVKHDHGDIVVIELRATCSHKLFATASPYGLPAGMCISCEGLAQEGWMRIAAPGSMPPHVFEWRKSPSTTPASPAK